MNLIRYTPVKLYKLDVRTLLDAEVLIKKEEMDDEVLQAREILNSILSALDLKAKNIDMEMTYSFNIVTQFQKGRKKAYEIRLTKENQSKLDYLFKFINHENLNNSQAEEYILNALLFSYVNSNRVLNGKK
jgi:hypothetical protein